MWAAGRICMSLLLARVGRSSCTSERYLFPPSLTSDFALWLGEEISG